MLFKLIPRAKTHSKPPRVRKLQAYCAMTARHPRQERKVPRLSGVLTP